MGPEPVKVLLVEDESGFSEIVSAELSDALGPETDVRQAPTLAGALGALEGAEFDAILLDLGLPDSDGVGALEQLLEVAPDTPIVVLTGRDQPDLPLKAIRAGAQDFLTKTGSDSATVARSLTYAIERYRLVSELSQDLVRVQNLVVGTDPADASSSDRLAATDHELMKEMAAEYNAALDFSIAPSASSNREPIAKRMRNLGITIASKGGAARDVVDVHIQAMSERDGSSADSLAITSESQLLLVELMGHVLSVYRKQLLDK